VVFYFYFEFARIPPSLVGIGQYMMGGKVPVEPNPGKGRVPPVGMKQIKGEHQ